MKYIRTKDGIWLNGGKFGFPCEGIVGKKDEYDFGFCFDKKDIIKQADTIEKLCDEFVYFINGMPFVTHKGEIHYVAEGIPVVIYGAIWTDKGLIYVAKMNDKGELELL